MQGHFEEYQNKMKEQISEKLSYENVDALAAQQILDEIDGRSKGNLPSPVLETLLTYNYQNDPAREFLDAVRDFSNGGLSEPAYENFGLDVLGPVASVNCSF